MAPNDNALKAELDRVNLVVAQRVRIEMARHGIGPQALAQQTGIKLGTLKRRIRRLRPLAFEPGELITVAHALGVEASALLPESPEEAA